MIELKEIKKAKLKYDIKTNRDEGKISGKIINIEKEFTVGEILDTDFKVMPIAMSNFILRRIDFVDEKNENKKAYYGHVGLFGYFVAEDEILKWIK